MIVHFPGRTNFFADATSCNPSQLPDPLEAAEKRLASVTAADIAVTLEDIAAAERGNPQYLPTKHQTHPHCLHTVPCIPRQDICVRQPTALQRPDDHHCSPLAENPPDPASAHQGISSMNHCASQMVFWPGLTNNIARAECHTCNLIAPSQPQVPVEQSSPPSTPFEAKDADYFDPAGMHYLVTVDRLSGWINVTRTTPGSASSGAIGLIACLRAFSQTRASQLKFCQMGAPSSPCR